MPTQEELTELNKALTAGIPEGQALRFQDTNYLETEIYFLPVMDLNIRFLYRFRKPFETVFTEGRVSYAYSVEDRNEEVKKLVLSKFLTKIKETLPKDAKNISEKSLSIYEKLAKIEEVKLIEMKMVEE